MSPWSFEEDQILLDALSQYNTKWKLIQNRLNYRSVSSIRNRWVRIKKGHQAIGKECKGRNKCTRCGQIKLGHICTTSTTLYVVQDNDTPLTEQDNDAPLTEQDNLSLVVCKKLPNHKQENVSKMLRDEPKWVKMLEIEDAQKATTFL